MPVETLYTPRFSTPDFLQRDSVDQVVELPVFRDGALVAPTSGTFTLLDESGGTVQTGAITVVNSAARFTVLATNLPETLALSERYQEKWELVMPDSPPDSFTFFRDASLVLRRLYPVVTDADLLRLHSEIRRWFAHDQGNAQGYLDAAWDTIQLRLLEQGRRPYLIMSPWSTRGVHLNLTLSYIFRDYGASASVDGKYNVQADRYMKLYEKSWDTLKFSYDYSEDDKIDVGEEGIAGDSVIMTTVPGNWWIRSVW